MPPGTVAIHAANSGPPRDWHPRGEGLDPVGYGGRHPSRPVEVRLEVGTSPLVECTPGEQIRHVFVRAVVLHPGSYFFFATLAHER